MVNDVKHTFATLLISKLHVVVDQRPASVQSACAANKTNQAASPSRRPSESAGHIKTYESESASALCG